MKKYFVYLFALFCMNHAFGATGANCKNILITQLTSKLESATNLDLKSTTLETDVRKLLLPELRDIIENNPECSSVKEELRAYTGETFSVNFPNHRFDIVLDFMNTQPVDIPDEIESVLPWFGILVVQKGALDQYANAATPIISSEYMKQHKDEFFPKNSNKFMGVARACTHGNHMAHDKDIINRATHIVQDEKDSFWSGNDYYVYDGEDVYWGWAQLAGEVALALVTLGLSAEAQAAAASVEAANIAVQGASKAVAAAKLSKNATKIAQAAAAAKKATSGTSAAAVASRTNAVKALAEAGITVKKGTRASELVKIGNALDAASRTIRTYKWTSSLAHPWRLVKAGATNIKPTTVKMYGPGVEWGQRIKRAALSAAGAGIGIELIKAFGYSSATVKLSDDVKFNGFGLLSADDLEGRENEVSHGAWLKFEEGGIDNADDALNEALRYAEELAKNIKEVNDQDPLCQGLDIYVVQPGISNPRKMNNKHEVYYIIQNPAGSARVE